MSGATKILAAAGGKADPVYVDNVFSSDTWLANDANGREIENGIDLAGEGGLVWIKNRGAGGSQLNHLVCDTLRPVSGGNAPRLMTNSGGVEASYGFGLQSFNDDGYSIGSAGDTNSGTTRTYVGWTFRKTAGFFDMVKYTGDSNDQTISHNLGSTPGFAIIKGIDTGNANWITWHRSHGNDKYSAINSSSSNGGDLDSSRTVNSTTFQILGDSSHDQGGFDHESTNGREYMLYLFAHDDESFGKDGDESIIQCGTYDGNGSAAGPEIDLGWEAQWVMIKNIEDTAGDNTLWLIADNLRGMSVGAGNDPYIAANNANEEYTSYNWIHPTAAGFKLTNTGVSLNESGTKYIYIAIRRSNKPPEAGTEVFAIDTEGNAGSLPGYRSGFPVDMIIRPETGGGSFISTARLLQSYQLTINGTNTETGSSTLSSFDYNNGFSDVTGVASNRIGYMFKRAPEFMDVVCYVGNNGTNTAIPHSLGVAPEMIIVKNRDASTDWACWTAGLSGTLYYIRPNGNQAEANQTTGVFGTSAATTTNFYVDDQGNTQITNDDGDDYIAYLFATVDGVSKVGSYTADATLTTINCGFSAAARFILIKRIDATGDWFLYDSVIQGIVSGNDPYILLNTTDAQVTGTDYVDPDNSGFQITAAGSSTINVDGGEYIFLAIA